MRILVTGATGAIGSALLPALDPSGADVATVDLRPLDRPGHAVANLEDPHAVRALLDPMPDVVIHLAGSAGSDIDRLFRTNVLATVNLLESLAPGARVIVAGSAAEYGAGKGEPIKESDPLRPVNPYGWSKAAQTTIAAAIAERRTLRLVIVRPFNVVSSNLPQTTALGNMRRQLGDNPPGSSFPIVTGRLDVVRDYVPIGFVAQALAALALDPDSVGTFNVCSGVGLTLGDILTEMGRIRNVDLAITPDPKLVALPAASIVIGDPSRLEERLGLAATPTAASIASLVLGAGGS